MSKSREIQYTCPYCGKEFQTTIYESINVKEDVDLKDNCMSGDIFKHLCPHCHTDFMIQNPLVYMDYDLKFMLWVSTEDVPDQVVQLAKPLHEKGYKLRRCETIQQFTEKLQIFEDHMDDIVVELGKYDSFIEYIDNRQGNPEEVTSIEYQYTKDDVMKINVRCDDKGLSFLIPIAGLEEEIRAQSDRYAVDNARFPLVDSNWIIQLFLEEDKPLN